MLSEKGIAKRKKPISLIGSLLYLSQCFANIVAYLSYIIVLKQRRICKKSVRQLGARGLF